MTMRSSTLARSLSALLLAASLALPALAQDHVPSYATAEPLGTALENWAYPYPVQMLQFEMEGRPVRMAYMDVRPENPNGLTLVLLHGKNFGSDYWAQTLKTMSGYGYRVIAPDQIGFGKSSKPEIRYTFTALADNTARLLDHLRIERAVLIGNSMGGMLAVHFARRYPQRVVALVLENPLGLEDYRPVIPAQETANLVRLEMAQTPASYRNFVRSYFSNWKPEYERFVEQFARLQLSGDYPRLALISALTYQMIYDGPIYDELPKLTVPTLLVIGQQDRTVFGRRFAPPEIVRPLGNFPQLGRLTQQRIPGSVLKEFHNVGHVPHLEATERFHAVIQDFIYGRK
jgi:pimeloyl-ACP methyl ester carboxylesterase